MRLKFVFCIWLFGLLSALPTIGSETKTSTESITVEVADLDASNFIWLPGSQGWPTPRKETQRPFAKSKKIVNAVVLQNDWFKVRFLPEIGARIYDLRWNSDNSSPIFCKQETLFQGMSRDEGHGYMVHFGSVKWGFPYFGHAPLDHAAWQYKIKGGKSGSKIFHSWIIDKDNTGLRLDVFVSVSSTSTALDVEFKVSNPSKKTQAWDLWTDIYVPASEFTEMALPTNKVITHQGAWNRERNMVIPFPKNASFSRNDLRFLKDWHASNGIFPLHYSDNFTGYYCHDRRQGMLRTFEACKGIGAKFWMPYVGWSDGPQLGEMFVGSNITHDERRNIKPGETFGWKERWIMVRNLKGIDFGDQNIAGHIESDKNSTRVYLISAEIKKKAEVRLEILGSGNGKVETFGTMQKVDLTPGKSVTAEFPSLPKQFGSLICRIDYGSNSYTWTTDGDLIKSPFQHEDLEEGRKNYQNSLQLIQAAKTKETTRKQKNNKKKSAFPIKEEFTFLQKIEVDTASRLYRPNAGTVLKDGTFVIADANTLLNFDASFNYVGKWGGKETLFCPLGLTVDDKGRLLVADTGNRRILRLKVLDKPWKIEIEWKVPYRCADIAWNNGTIAFSAPLQHRVFQFPDTSPSGAITCESVTDETLCAPFGICFQQNDLIVADTLNSRVLQISPKGKTKILANKSHGLSKPSRVCLHKNRLLITDGGRNCLFEKNNGDFRKAIQGNLLNEVSMAIPGGLVSSKNRVLMTVADPAQLVLLNDKMEIQKVYAVNNNSGLTGYRPNSASVLSDGRTITIDDTGGRVRLFDKDGKQIRTAGSWGREDGQLWEPSVVRVDSKDNVYISDLLNYRILRFDSKLHPAGVVELQSVRTEGVLKTSFWYAFGMAIGPDDNLYVADHAGGRIQVFTPAPENKLIQSISLGKNFHPLGIDVDKNGNLIAANSFSANIALYYSKQKEIRLINLGSSLLQPHAVAIDGQGGFWVSGQTYSGSPSNCLLHFSGREGITTSYSTHHVKSPGDLLRYKENLLITSRYNDSRRIYSLPLKVEISKDKNYVKAKPIDFLVYPDWPIVPGEPNNTDTILCLDDGHIVAAQGNSSTFDRYSADFKFLDSNLTPSESFQWAHANRDELFYFPRGKKDKYVRALSRKTGKLVKHWFKGVNELDWYYSIGNNNYFVREKQIGHIYHGEGEGAKKVDSPEWLNKNNKDWFGSAIPLSDGTTWITHWHGALKKLVLLKIDKELKLIKTVDLPKGFWLDLFRRTQNDEIIGRFYGGLIKFDKNGENGTIILNKRKLRSGDFTPDGKYICIGRMPDRSSEILVYVPKAKEEMKTQTKSVNGKNSKENQ